MATVYLAKEAKLERQVALKIMSSKLLSDPSFADRFLREARIVASLSHRNIVHVFDVGSHNDFNYMAMELLPGGDLKAKLKQGVQLSDGLRYMKEVAAGLQYAGAKKFIHRDIKPENIMFGEDGTAVITDFGIARNTESQTNMTMVGSVIGTPHYMSPEQAGAEELDHRSDLYSLGVMLYELLTGQPPFQGDSAISIGVKHITEDPPPLPDEHARFQPLIDKALAKNRDERFQSGDEFIEAITALESGASASEATTILSSQEMRRRSSGSGFTAGTPMPGSPTVLDRGKKSLAVPLLAAGVVLAGVGGAGGYYFYSQQSDQPAVSNTPAIGPTGTTPVNGGNKAPVFAGSSERTQALLDAAVKALEEGRLYKPSTNSAEFYLTTLLALDPNSAQGREKVAELFRRYLDNASAGVEKSELDQAYEFVTQANRLTYYVTDDALKKQHQELFNKILLMREQKIIADSIKEEVEALLAKADKQLAENKLTSPTGDNAYDSFQQVLQLDPQNEKAAEGIKRVADAFLANALAQAKAGNFSAAYAFIAASGQIMPTNPEIAKTREALEKIESDSLAKASKSGKADPVKVKVKAKKDDGKAKKVAKLLTEIDVALKDKRLTRPKDNNALSKFREVQSLDPLNADVIVALDKVVAALTIEADSAIKKGSLKNAQLLVNEARNLSPANKKVRGLQSDINQAKEQARKDYLLAQEKKKKEAAEKQAKAIAGRVAEIQGAIAAKQFFDAIAIADKGRLAFPGNSSIDAERNKAIELAVKEGNSLVKANKLAEAKLIRNKLIDLNIDTPEFNAFNAALNKVEKQADNSAKIAKLEAEIDRAVRAVNDSTAKTLLGQLQSLKRMDSSNSRISKGYSAIDGYYISQIEKSINSRKLTDARKRLESFQPLLDDSAALKTGLAESLANTERLYSEASKYIQAAILELATPYAGPSRFGTDKKERERFFGIYKNLTLAESIDERHSQLGMTFEQLEAEYIRIIKLHIKDKRWKYAEGWKADAISMQLPGRLADKIVINKPEKSTTTFTGGGF